MSALCRRPSTYGAFILSLRGVFREELTLIETVKGRFPHVEVWLTDIDGRQSALAEAMRLGAAGLLGADGLHRVGVVAGGNSQPAPNGTKAAHLIDGPPTRTPRHGTSTLPTKRRAPSSEPAVLPIQSETSAHPAPDATIPSATPSFGVRLANGRSRSPNGTPAHSNAGNPYPASSAADSEALHDAIHSPATLSSEPQTANGGLSGIGEPVLTAEELRALLEDDAVRPTSNDRV
jgi:hypothetical protein